MKNVIISGLLFGMAHGTVAAAGPFVNVESNAAWQDGFQTAVTEAHVGYEFENGVYLQAGSAFVAEDGEEVRSEISGKIGVTADISESLEAYGEVAFITEDQSFTAEEISYATKVGVTYRF